MKQKYVLSVFFKLDIVNLCEVFTLAKHFFIGGTQNG